VKQAGWTLLVQGVDLHDEAAHALLARFRFVPDARLDDLMISYASDGGGVGPHFDSYDVFLLQVHGRRRWRIGRLTDTTLQPDVPLKILAHFEAEEEHVLEPGDMLYLPPRWAHDGVAEGECMTCSIGFRAAARDEVGREVLHRLLDGEEPAAAPTLYRDPSQSATDAPARIPSTLQAFTGEAVARLVENPKALAVALGEWLSEPKPLVHFDGGVPLEAGHDVVLDRRTRMLYDDEHVFINGESYRAAGADAVLMRQLADRRRLPAAQWQRASDDARALLDDWLQAGGCTRTHPLRRAHDEHRDLDACRVPRRVARHAGRGGRGRLPRAVHLRRRLRRLAARRARGGGAADALGGGASPAHRARAQLRRDRTAASALGRVAHAVVACRRVPRPRGCRGGHAADAAAGARARVRAAVRRSAIPRCRVARADRARA
jgi:50S ribosomal protein L16 3-hydroxylase